MSANLSPVLSADEIKSLEQDIISASEADGHEAAWQKAQGLLNAQSRQSEAAQALLRVVDEQCLSRQAAVGVLTEIAKSYPDNADAMRMVGVCLEAARDIDDLNAPPPGEAIYSHVVEILKAFAREHEGLEDENRILRGLATASRMMARQRDDIAEASYRKLVDLNPKRCTDHYNLGLFYKTRGRFAEGMAANQTAVELSEEVVDGYEWNLGICATGADHGEVALEVWKRMGQKIEMGRFGLPEGGYPQCKVKLAERPLAERSAEDDDPGLEETIWIERLSPCHGIIRSVLYQDLGINYGDVILIDGAPITYHTYGEEQIAVFPHLATLKRQNYQIFKFAGTQDEARQLANASADLDADAIVYSHTENYQELCSNCWRDPDLDHDRHEAMEKHVVTGRIAAPAHVSPEQLLGQIDKAVAERCPCQIYAPDLCIAAGQDKRASVEKRRFDMLMGN